jgi:hypothetical protein
MAVARALNERWGQTGPMERDVPRDVLLRHYGQYRAIAQVLLVRVLAVATTLSVDGSVEQTLGRLQLAQCGVHHPGTISRRTTTRQRLQFSDGTPDLAARRIEFPGHQSSVGSSPVVVVAMIGTTTVPLGRAGGKRNDPPRVKPARDLGFSSAPGGIRTPDLVRRRHTLYPAELRTRNVKCGEPMVEDGGCALRPLFSVICCASVGAPGFEPGTSCSRSRRANRAALRPEYSSMVDHQPSTWYMGPEGFEPPTF